MSERTFYGGQAVIEGVMMRGPRYFAVACRRANGEIVVKQEAVPLFFTRFVWARWPFLRGVFALLDTLGLGMKSLLYSAELARDADDEGMPAEDISLRNGADPGGQEDAYQVCPTARRGCNRDGEQRSISSLAISGSAAIGLGLGIFLFVLLPHLLTRGLQPIVSRPLALNLIEGAVRVAIALGYIWGIARMKRVQRLFQYHGAEHQAINAWEQEGSLDLQVAARQSRIHPRCGTNFLLTVLIVKVLIYPFFGWPPLLVGFALRLALLPVVAALSFEVIRLAGQHRDCRPLQWLVAPGLLTQRLTTREPDLDMLEVSLRALRSVIEQEEAVHRSDIAPAPTMS
ncbi:MAG: DUF1385 domain-containing protein [Armatimonadetes bacterium]|nr:DUF1385 domain-containing protein [Armatimonadota bacterium]